MMKVLTEDNRFELKQNEREDVTNNTAVLNKSDISDTLQSIDNKILV